MTLRASALGRMSALLGMATTLCHLVVLLGAGAESGAAVSSPVMPVVDVPLFRLRCRVDSVSGPPGSAAAPAPAAEWYVGQLGSPTSDVVQGNGTQWSDWTVFNSTHANLTAHQYPNWAGHEAEFGPFPMLVARLVASPHLLHVPSNEPYFVTTACEWRIDPSAAHPTDRGEGRLHGKLMNQGGDSQSYMGLILSRGADGDTPSVSSFADFNQQQYFSVMELFPERQLANRITINDGISGDDSFESHSYSHAGQERLGFTLLNDEPKWRNVSFKTRIARTINMEGPYVLGAHDRWNKTSRSSVGCGPAGASGCTIHDYMFGNGTDDAMLVNETDIGSIVAQQLQTQKAAGYQPNEVKFLALLDEPGWGWPDAAPPVNSSAAVRRRWQAYLQRNQMTPKLLGATSWDDVLPCGRADAGALAPGASEVNITASPLQDRRRFYWSVRFSVWDAARYVGDWNHAYLEQWSQTLGTYVNFNNFHGRLYSPGNCQCSSVADRSGVGGVAASRSLRGENMGDPNTAALSFDWFEFARSNASTLLWTEDWFKDADSHRWSFYLARLRSAAALSPNPVTSFAGYIVPRSSGQFHGGLLQRVLTMVGSGSKIVKYFTWGPEYVFPSNCYSDVPDKADMFGQLAKAHAMIARADDLLYEGVHPPARVAILYPRSSFMWDAWGSAGGPVCMCCCTSSMVAHNNDYTVETYGLYLALRTDSNIPIDFIDEDALLEPHRLSNYKLIIVTEPNVPTAGQRQLVQWTQAGGTLITTSNSMSADEYNEPSTIVSEELGVTETNRERHTFLSETEDHIVGRGSVTLPGGGGTSASAIPFVAVGVRGAMTLTRGSRAKATVLGQFEDGQPALVETPVGRGSLLRFAYMPGVSYWFNQRDPSTRSLLVRLVRRVGVSLPVHIGTAQVEAPLAVSSRGAVLTLLNFQSSSQPPPLVEHLNVSVTLPFRPRSVESVEHGALNFSVSQVPTTGAEVQVRFCVPLLSFGDLVLLHASTGSTAAPA